MTARASTPGVIRIIGGQLRNSRLQVPELDGLRPTPQRIRETLFNWLAPRIAGMQVLDLFAGTGALSIEALSRGAAHACMVERDQGAAQALQLNLQRLKLQAQTRLARTDALTFLATAATPYDLVLVDPPFALQLWQPVIEQLENAHWLADGAWIYLESPLDQVPPVPAWWQLYREGMAGAVRYALYRRGAGLG